jgi:hypothetical protein
MVLAALILDEAVDKTLLATDEGCASGVVVVAPVAAVVVARVEAMAVASTSVVSDTAASGAIAVTVGTAIVAVADRVVGADAGRKEAAGGFDFDFDLAAAAAAS